MARGPDHRTVYEEITGQTPDISQWLDFEFYNHVWWWGWPHKPDFTDNPHRLAQWFHVIH
jgi:hypothetical protein